MTTTTEAAPTCEKVRKPRPKPLEAVNPAVELLAYSTETGYGVLVIDDVLYVMKRITDENEKTIGMKLARPTEDRDGNHIVKRVEIDFTAEHGWQCNCEDATYQPHRPGGCKHVVSLKKVAAEMKSRVSNETEARPG